MLFIERPYEFTPVVIPNNVDVIVDVPYMDGARHTLDIYQPTTEATTARPVIIDIYGGGLYFGDKSSHKLQNSLALTAAGYTVISPDYSLIWQAPFPTQIYEIKAVIRWVRAHAAEYNLDPDRIVLSGESSGAHLAVLTAATASQGAMRNVLFGDYPNYSEEVAAVIASYGPYQFDLMPAQFKILGIEPKFTETGAPNSFEGQMFGQKTPASQPNLVKEYDPMTYFSPSLPPLFVIAGTADDVVPVLQSQTLATAALQVLPANQVAWYWVPGGHHGPADYQSDELYQFKVDRLATWLADVQ